MKLPFQDFQKDHMSLSFNNDFSTIRIVAYAYGTNKVRFHVENSPWRYWLSKYQFLFKQYSMMEYNLLIHGNRVQATSIYSTTFHNQSVDSHSRWYFNHFHHSLNQSFIINRNCHRQFTHHGGFAEIATLQPAVIPCNYHTTVSWPPDWTNRTKTSFILIQVVLSFLLQTVVMH